MKTHQMLFEKMGRKIRGDGNIKEGLNLFRYTV
jgi:hypothetical protein